MQAVWLKEFGSPEVLHVQETPDPRPEAGQVLVEIEFAGITWIETMFRANGFGPFPAPPMIPGNGVGGTVVEVGSVEHEHLRGRRVVTGTGGSGGYAQRVVVGAEQVIPIPDGVGTADATALLADGRTALMILAAANVQPGERVLVEAAAGGVGSLLVQLVRSARAQVVGAAGGPAKVQVASELGAHLTVDYREAGWAEAIRGDVGGVDVVLDGVGGDVALSAATLLGRGGRLISFGFSSAAGWPDISDEDAERRGIRVQRGVFGPTEEQTRRTTEALALAEAGLLKPLIGQQLPLAQAAEAHAAMEARTVLGKTLLVP
ncbi:NADPH:quinone reductase [Kineosporia sp. NBRC 101677]|uniref:zinc-binding dehydrogenase n=1 Tax=Kineosporia sp. NBRC 101677 TaxID=3032197 RepID=UPI0024A5557B|nr:NADPH:quinone reductase [Kineosporia sp. NBRC 101677]